MDLIQRIEKLENIVSDMADKLDVLQNERDIICHNALKSNKLEQCRYELVKLCAKAGISYELMISPRRSVKLVNDRYICAMHLVGKGFLKVDIAKVMHRDHTSIGYLLERGIR